MEVTEYDERVCWNRFRKEFPEVYYDMGGSDTRFPDIRMVRDWLDIYGLTVDPKEQTACEVLLENLWLIRNQQQRSLGSRAQTSSKRPPETDVDTRHQKMQRRPAPTDAIFSKPMEEFTMEDVEALYAAANALGVDASGDLSLGELRDITLLTMSDQPVESEFDYLREPEPSEEEALDLKPRRSKPLEEARDVLEEILRSVLSTVEPKLPADAI